jgi:hypothetical protein
MALPRKGVPSLDERVRGVDREWAERLASDAERFERRERVAALRRAGVCLVLAGLVVWGGVEGFRYETDTRWAPVRHVVSPGWVRVTIGR